MLNVVMLSVLVLNVVAPLQPEPLGKTPGVTCKHGKNMERAAEEKLSSLFWTFVSFITLASNCHFLTHVS